MPILAEAPQYKETIKNEIAYDREDLSTNVAGTVISYDNVKQTITARPVMYHMDADGISSRMSDIPSVPVLFYGSGGGSFTVPIKKGDPCWVSFSQRAFDTWWMTGKLPSQPSTQRMHDYNDAVAILGLKDRQNSLQASTENVELRYEDKSGNLINKITLALNGEVKIENKADSEIVLQQDGTIQSKNNGVTHTLNSNGSVDVDLSTFKVSNGTVELVDSISQLMDILSQDPNLATTTKTQITVLKGLLDTLKA